MRGVLVMTMATISPSGREVSPTGSSCRSSRLDLLKFRLMAAAKPRNSSRLIFFHTRTLHIAKEGGLVGLLEAHKPALRHQGGGGGAGACGPLARPLRWIFAQVFFFYSRKILRKFSGHSENFYFCTKITPWEFC